jgi:ribonucleoside-diphosphate reductase beta chain
LNAIEHLDCVKRKADWALRWIDQGNFQERLIAFAAVEGIFFSGSFCSIFWLKKRNIMSGLCSSNEFISRDEGMHCRFAILLYSKIKNKLPQSVIHDMFKDAVNVEKEFICESLPCSLLGMNSKLMGEYIEYVADQLLENLEYEKIYETANPFDFMESLKIEGKSNFFETRPTQYQKSSVLNKTKETAWEVIEEF